jgi:hypothetical protein
MLAIGTGKKVHPIAPSLTSAAAISQ